MKTGTWKGKGREAAVKGFLFSFQEDNVKHVTCGDHLHSDGAVIHEECTTSIRKSQPQPPPETKFYTVLVLYLQKKRLLRERPHKKVRIKRQCYNRGGVIHV